MARKSFTYRGVTLTPHWREAEQDWYVAHDFLTVSGATHEAFETAMHAAIDAVYPEE